MCVFLSFCLVNYLGMSLFLYAFLDFVHSFVLMYCFFIYVFRYCLLGMLLFLYIYIYIYM